MCSLNRRWVGESDDGVRNSRVVVEVLGRSVTRVVLGWCVRTRAVVVVVVMEMPVVVSVVRVVHHAEGRRAARRG